MKTKHLLYTAVILILTLAACNPTQKTAPAASTTGAPSSQENIQTDENPQSQTEATATTETTPSEITQSAQPQDLSACYHPYFPVVDGAYWTYQQPETGTYTMRIEDTGDNTFRMLQEMNTGQVSQATEEMDSEDVIFTSDWYCSEDGLLRGTFGQLDLLNNSSDGQDSPEFQFKTLEWEGETLPAPELIEVGYTWTSDYTLSADYDIEGFSGQMQVTVEIQHQVGAFEEVTVPAGTFSNALRVDSTGNIQMVMAMGENITTPFNSFDFSFSTWYTEGVGMVKSSESMAGYASSTELVDSSFLE